ncbi:MAG TPA: SufD family Fe-S cluster assembly protein [Candidatus Limnocylindrales bacterium]|nr:SufD family Fe-S cluster assembly protein [Candidatus Limnocylindrales bacterium]
MTAPTGEAAPTETAPAPRPRPARRALDDLGLLVTAQDIEGVADGEPEWLAADRRAAFEAFRALPSEPNRLYTPYIDLRQAALADSSVVTERAAIGEAAAQPDADAVVEIAEGRLASFAVSDAARAAGVTVRLLHDDLDAARELLTRDGSLPEQDRFAQMTRAAWSQGILVDIPAGVHLDRPIVVRWALGEADRALLSRTLIRLGEDAHASLVEELMPSDAAATAARQAFFAGTTEVTLGARATLRVASVQELPANLVVFQHRTAAIGDGAELHWALAQLGSRLVRSRVDNRLDGDNSSVEQVEIVFGGADQLFDLTSYTTHVGRDTTGNLLSKGALLDKSRSYMKGLITIERSAIGTDSYLGEFGMNLSKAARAVAIPSLEIDQPDCRRAAHSSSVGPIDETQLFYLESRGIPPDEARKFIVLGFLEPVVARVPLADVQDRLRALLEAKWASGTVDSAVAA